MSRYVDDHERADVIEIVPYDPAWAESFAVAAERLTVVLDPYLARPLEHIGSTAIPGLAAKSVVDMLAIASSVDVVPDPLAELTRLS